LGLGGFGWRGERDCQKLTTKGKAFSIPFSPTPENGNEKLPLGRSEASLMPTLNQFGQKM